MNWRHVVSVMAVLALASCGGQDDHPDQTRTDQPAMNEGTRADQQNNNPDAGLHLSTVNVCERLPAELVAAAADGTAVKPARRSDYGSSQGCEYDIDPSGADTYEYVAIWPYPPSLFGNPHDDMALDRRADQEVTTERLTGLGDEASVIHNTTEQQSYIHILLRGRMYLEVRAERHADARKIAEVTLSRL